MKRIIFFFFLFALTCGQLRAQKFSIGTNVLSYANFLTTNLEMSYAVSRNWTVFAQGKYNPWTFNEGTKDQMQNRQLSFAVGTKYYPWMIYTGWYASAQLQYTKYNTGGIIKSDTYEGEVYGLGIGAGYSWLLSKHWNIDFGIGLLVGPNSYVKYACPKCGRMEEKAKKIYVGPNNLLVQLTYMF